MKSLQLRNNTFKIYFSIGFKEIYSESDKTKNIKGTIDIFIFTTFGQSLIFPLKEKIISISLLFILFAPVATIYLYLQFEKSSIQREIKWKMIAGMNQEELVLLKFSTEETATKLRWEHDKEFEYNGQLYDVVSKEIKGDSIFYRCWLDYEETDLNKKLKKMVAIAFDQDEDHREAQEGFYTYLWSFFCTAPFDWQATASQNAQLVFQDSMHPNIFNSIRLTPPTPPPKYS